MAETQHTAESVQFAREVNVEALERHLFSKGNYPDNVWPVDWPWEGPELAYQCAVNELERRPLRNGSDEPTSDRLSARVTSRLC